VALKSGFGRRGKFFAVMELWRLVHGGQEQSGDYSRFCLEIFICRTGWLGKWGLSYQQFVHNSAGIDNG